MKDIPYVQVYTSCDFRGVNAELTAHFTLGEEWYSLLALSLKSLGDKSIESLIVGPHTESEFYTNDNFTGKVLVIYNGGDNPLKISCLDIYGFKNMISSIKVKKSGNYDTPLIQVFNDNEEKEAWRNNKIKETYVTQIVQDSVRQLDNISPAILRDTISRAQLDPTVINSLAKQHQIMPASLVKDAGDKLIKKYKANCDTYLFLVILLMVIIMGFVAYMQLRKN